MLFGKQKKSNSCFYFENKLIKIPKSKRSTRVFNQLLNIKGLPDSKRSQVSMEYVIILGFVMFAIIGTLGIAFFYSGNIKDNIKLNQVNNFADKIIATAENVFYYGEPSKATISVYLPEGVENITILDKDIIISTHTSSGLEKRAFSSNVQLEGNIPHSSGIKKLVVQAAETKVTINPA